MREVSKTYSIPKSFIGYRKPRAVSTKQRERAVRLIPFKDHINIEAQTAITKRSFDNDSQLFFQKPEGALRALQNSQRTENRNTNSWNQCVFQRGRN